MGASVGMRAFTAFYQLAAPSAGWSGSLYEASCRGWGGRRRVICAEGFRYMPCTRSAPKGSH